MVKRFHFQVNSRVTYDVAEIEANSLEEATEKLRWHYAKHNEYPNLVARDIKEQAEDLKAFLGINAL